MKACRRPTAAKTRTCSSAAKKNAPDHSHPSSGIRRLFPHCRGGSKGKRREVHQYVGRLARHPWQNSSRIAVTYALVLKYQRHEPMLAPKSGSRDRRQRSLVRKAVRPFGRCRAMTIKKSSMASRRRSSPMMWESATQDRQPTPPTGCPNDGARHGPRVRCAVPPLISIPASR